MIKTQQKEEEMSILKKGHPSRVGRDDGKEMSDKINNI